MSLSKAGFMGGGRYQAFTGTFSPNPRLARGWSLAPSAAGNVDMLDATTLPRGGPLLILRNLGPGTPLTLRTYGGISFASLPINQVAELHLADNSTRDGVWILRVRPIGSGSGSMNLLKLYAFCGINQPQTASVYTPATNTWAASAAATRSHVDGAVLQIGSRAFVCGFYTLGGLSVANDEFNAKTSAWLTRLNIPYQAGRTCGAASSRRTLAIIFGGDSHAEVFSMTTLPGSSTFIAYTARRNLPLKKGRCSAQALEGLDRVIIVGGDPVPSPNLAHNIGNDTYWTIANLPTLFRHSMSTFLVNGRLYACGGRSETPTVQRWQYCDEYAPLTDVWTSRAPLSVGARYTGVGLGGNARGFYLGGYDNSDVASVLAISYLRDTWSSIANLDAARAQAANMGAAM